MSMEARKAVGRLGASCKSEEGDLSRLVEKRDGCQSSTPGEGMG